MIDPHEQAWRYRNDYLDGLERARKLSRRLNMLRRVVIFITVAFLVFKIGGTLLFNWLN